MGLFDGVGGPLGGMMPLGTMMPMGVATSMGAAASAVGVPGFSMMPPTFPLIAGMGWSSRSSYFGQPEFRGVADMAIGSNNLQRGWSPSFMGGLGTYGIGASPVGSGGYPIGPGPQFFDPMAMFAWMYQQTFGPAQQPAGPAQPAAPQPAQVNAKGEEPKADEAGKGGKPVRRGGGGKGKKAAAAPAAAGSAENPTAKELDAIQDLSAKAKKAGGFDKLDPKDQKQLEGYVKKYPKIFGLGDEKKGDGTQKSERGRDAKAQEASATKDAEAVHQDEVAQKRKRWPILHKKAQEGTLTDEAEKKEWKKIENDIEAWPK